VAVKQLSLMEPSGVKSDALEWSSKLAGDPSDGLTRLTAPPSLTLFEVFAPCLPLFCVLCSAASALLMLSCFFHFVRRFWNQIFT